MVDTDSDQELRDEPRIFASNYSADEEKSLCHMESDEHFPLHQHLVQSYTPENYQELSGRHDETYDVVSIPCSEHDKTFYNEEPIVKSKPRRVTHPPETDTTSSDSEARPRSRPRNTGPVTDGSSDSSNSGSGYGGDIDSDFEASRKVDQHKKPADDNDHQYNCRTVTRTISRRTFCNRITSWQQINLPAIILAQCLVRIINCKLHCRGLDSDVDERNATLTAVVKFCEKSIACSSSHDCFVELGVDIYEGRIDQAKEAKLLGTAKERRKLTKQEREEHVMHIAVHRTVKLDAIIYNEACPKLITVQITASVQTSRNEGQECDSGCIVFDASKSSGLGHSSGRST